VNKPKVSPEAFIDFLVVTPLNATAIETQRTNPPGNSSPAHDAYMRLLHRLQMSNPGNANLLIGTFNLANQEIGQVKCETPAG